MKKSFLVIIVLIAFISCTEEKDDGIESSMKGYEIYSWKENTMWHYVITYGTNAIKSYGEIINSENIFIGEEELKEALSYYSKGEQFSWKGELWLARCWIGDYGNLSLPPDEIIQRIKDFCLSEGFDLTISN